MSERSSVVTPTQCVHVGVVHRDFVRRHASRALVVVFWRNSPALHREPTTSETTHCQTEYRRYQTHVHFYDDGYRHTVFDCAVVV